VELALNNTDTHALNLPMVYSLYDAGSIHVYLKHRTFIV